MAKFFIHQPLPAGEVAMRENLLVNQLGLSEECIAAFKKHTPHLCDFTKAQQRVDNLNKLGFRGKEIIERNPSLLSRKTDTVSYKFYKVQAWFGSIDPDIDMHKLFVQRAQLWSVGEKKFFICCSLACIIGRGVTVGRLCNLLTLSVEDVLLAYIEGAYYDFSVLCFVARKKRKVNSSKEEKIKCIKEYLCLLPHEVCKKYLF